MGAHVPVDRLSIRNLNTFVSRMNLFELINVRINIIR